MFIKLVELVNDEPTDILIKVSEIMFIRSISHNDDGSYVFLKDMDKALAVLNDVSDIEEKMEFLINII